MSDSFASEMKSWWEVIKLRKLTLSFFSLVVILMITLFLVMVSEYRLELAQVSQLSTQMELIVEVDRDLGTEQIVKIQNEIEEMPVVEKVDFWSAERSAQYINDQILPGYLSFLEKNQLGYPVNPLFRITLLEIGQKEVLERVLSEKYPDQMLALDLAVDQSGQSFARRFVDNIQRSIDLFQILIILQFIFLCAISGYMTAFILSERSRGFHLTQLLHLAPPYRFWPAFLLELVSSMVLCGLAFLVTFLLTGQLLVVLSGLIFFAFVLLDLILVWFGRYVVVKWGLR